MSKKNLLIAVIVLFILSISTFTLYQKSTLTFRDNTNNTLIDHGNGLTTKYAHLKPGNPYNLNIGDFVSPTSPIANMGTTGFSNPAHLHFEVRVNNQAVDPDIYLGTNPQNLSAEEEALWCSADGGGGNAGGLFSLSNEEIADEASKEIEIEHKQSILGYSVAWTNDQEVPFKNVEIQTDEGKINLPFPKVMVNKRDQDFGTIVIHNERLYQNDQEISPGFMLSPDFKIFEQFYLEDTDTGQKFHFNDCVDYPNIFARSAGECWLDSSGKPKPILKATEYIKTYKIKGTLRRLIKENLILGYEEYRTPKNDSIIELLGSPLRDDPSANMAAVIDGEGSDVPDMRYRLGYDDFIQTIADSACILSNFVVSPFGSYVYCQAVYRMLIGAGINPGVNEMALQAENISMATLVSGGSPVGDLIGLKRFFVSEVAQAGLANQASRQFTEEATNGILNREFAESASLKANARNGSQALIDSIGGASQLAKNGREVFEAAKIGVTKEGQELVARSISKPSIPEKIDRNIFNSNQTLADDVMGSQYNSYDKLPRTLKTGQPKSINYDGSTLTTNYEMKWYSNPVSLTYQLRLEIFLTLKEGKTFVLITKNGSAATDVNAPFRSLMEKYPDKIKIEKFISQ